MPKDIRIYNGEKTVSSINGTGNTGQLPVNQEVHGSHIAEAWLGEF